MASTYSNLKFELIGTGDQSGTWGTTTNTNLGTAIEQAIVGMATISSGFVANSLTLTLTDTNAAQNARALVLNLTQSLSGAGTLNVPAIQKPYMIINATGQTVTVKVTGLTGVAVPTGTRAFLYNNGTDVGDFFNYASSLTLGTDLAVADGGTGASTAPNARTNLGATTVGSNLFTLTNPSAITFLRINADNTVSALDAATFRTAIGAGTTSGAAGSNTQVQYNNAGAFAGSANFTFNGTTVTMANDASVNGLTVGRGAGAVVSNTAVGNTALGGGSQSGADNNAFGSYVLASNTTGYGNTGFGGAGNYLASALRYNTTGYGNSAFGSGALASTTTGAQNSAFGRAALYTNSTGSNNVAVGDGALNQNTTANNNTAVGYQAGYSNTTGDVNVFMGRQAGYGNTTGAANNAFGDLAMYTNSTGASNNAFGRQALYSNTTGNYNTALGHTALYSNTTASNNTAVGYQAMYANTTGDLNVAVGTYALDANTTGRFSTAVGMYALTSATTADGNVAVGYRAAEANTTGTNLVAIGVNALLVNTTGSQNVAMGRGALEANTTASNNTAVGYQAGYSNTTAGDSTFVGRLAGYGATGQFNTAIGSRTLETSGSGTDNTALGYGAGNSLTTGSFNTFLGRNAGASVSTGSKNTIVGYYNGNQGSLDIRTSSNYIVLSDGDGNPRMYFDTNGIANLRSSMLEQMTISATAATGTINFDAITQSVLYYTTNASGNFTMNVRGSSGVTLNNSMVTGQSLTIAFLCTNGSTAYYQTAMTIDGTSVTPKWQGGTAPSAGNASSIDSYVYTIIKTGSAAFTVLASQTKFA